jgi:hypothetical protein
MPQWGLILQSDPIRIAEAIKNFTFHAGDDVILAEGPNRYVRGKFLRLKDDVKWAAIEEPTGAISSHPVQWMRSYAERQLPTLDGEDSGYESRQKSNPASAHPSGIAG